MHDLLRRRRLLTVVSRISAVALDDHVDVFRICRNNRLAECRLQPRVGDDELARHDRLDDDAAEALHPVARGVIDEEIDLVEEDVERDAVERVHGPILRLVAGPMMHAENSAALGPRRERIEHGLARRKLLRARTREPAAPVARAQRRRDALEAADVEPAAIGQWQVDDAGAGAVKVQPGANGRAVVFGDRREQIAAGEAAPPQEIDRAGDVERLLAARQREVLVRDHHDLVGVEAIARIEPELQRRQVVEDDHVGRDAIRSLDLDAVARAGVDELLIELIAAKHLGAEMDHAQVEMRREGVDLGGDGGTCPARETSVDDDCDFHRSLR